MGEKTITGPVEPVSVSIVGTGDGGLPATGTIATTPGNHNPNLVVTVITPIVAILIRFANTFLTTLVGLVMAGMTPAGSHVLKANDFLELVLSCATLSVAGAGVGLLKDCITIFGKLEQKYPLGSGSV